MNKYILLRIIDEGIINIKHTKAESPRQALIKWDLYPFIWPEGWEHLLPEDYVIPEDPDEADEKFQETISGLFSWEQAVARVCKFYNLDEDPKWSGDHEGNFIDGDSNAMYVIIEITPRFDIKFYPTQRDYLGKVIQI